MKIVKADAKGRVTGFEPGAEYAAVQQGDTTTLQRTGREEQEELIRWAQEEMLPMPMRGDPEWQKHVREGIKFGPYRSKDDIRLASHGWRAARM